MANDDWDVSPPPKKQRSGCFWKAPLGCLAFAFGGTLVFLVLAPFACGRAIERQLEKQFNFAHEGSLEIESARIGSVFDEQSVSNLRLWDPEGSLVLRADVRLPSIGSVFERRGAASIGSVDLHIHVLNLRATGALEGPATNLAAALERRRRARNPDARIVSVNLNEDQVDGRRVDIQLQDGSLIHYDKGGAQFQGWGKLELKGALESASWSDSDGERRLEAGPLVLSGSFLEEDSGGRAKFGAEGPLVLSQEPDARGTLRFELELEADADGRTSGNTWRFHAALSSVGGGDADARLVQAFDAALATLMGTQLERDAGGASRWSATVQVH